MTALQANKKTNIAVLISGNGSNLQAIIDACESGEINGEICLVLSNVDNAFGLTRAERANISTAVLNHKDFKSREEYDAALLQIMQQFEPDLVVLAGFMRILTSDFVNHWLGRMINIHPSLLPKYQGLNTHKRAQEAGDTEHGASVHFVTPELDGGPVILQAKVAITPEDSAENLKHKVHQQEHFIYPIVVKWFCENRLALKSGQVFLDNQLLPETGYSSDV